MANIERIIRLRDFISERPPESVDMGNWCANRTLKEGADLVDELVPLMGHCGTTYCIAGYAVVLGLQSGELEPAHETIQEAAAYYLGYDSGLFHAYDWPGKCFNKWLEAGSPEENKQAVLARLDHLIETGE